MTDPLSALDINAVQQALVSWYEADHRSFPWRETEAPYEILVSEVMSQQTQLERIVGPWEDFIEQWPTVAALAGADRSDIVAFWSEHSLGYNNRARYLHEAAQQVQAEFGGILPRDPEELESLMGVGPYTATAVASFAFDTGGAVVDTNVKRVLHRAFGVPDDDTAFETAAENVVLAKSPGLWNNAIMELGGVACSKTPRCDGAECPWREWCRAYKTGDFTAPDVPTQPEFEGSRRQFRGRIVRTLSEHGELPLDELGPKIRVDYDPNGADDQEWLRDLVADLAGDGLLALNDTGEATVQLRP
ncbi:A/G-specific adenine glycosylase [Halodesulfurarchaeum sp.]|uniref:A/G-specific adenine glycosylase n=1 Tax=Halodesulfurarchaeum sp. TaxID=1980530 RepID=UPI002FC389DA